MILVIKLSLLKVCKSGEYKTKAETTQGRNNPASFVAVPYGTMPCHVFPKNGQPKVPEATHAIRTNQAK